MINLGQAFKVIPFLNKTLFISMYSLLNTLRLSFYVKMRLYKSYKQEVTEISA